MNLLSRVPVSLWLFIGLAVGIQAQQQDVSKTPFKLVQINFEGLVNVPKEKATASSGLKIGQTILLENLKQTSQRLIESGLFTSVKLRYKYTGDDLEATFIVAEARSSVPCFFDNFMWFSDEEIYAAIRQEIPNFDGKATEGGEMIEVIRKSLEKLLRTKSSTSNIEYEMAGLGTVHVFKVAGMPMPICSIDYQGVTAFSYAHLTNAAKELLSSEYSRMINSLVLRDTTIPLYRQRGYLKIKLLPVKASPEKNPPAKCKDGVALLVTFNEGIPYQWKGITWSGNQMLSNDKLNRLFTLKTDEIADGLKIDKGMTLTLINYTDRGYLDVRVKPVPTFDEATQSVTFSISITEGGQYSFGQLAVKGVPNDVIKSFLERWETLRGKTYDAASLQAFINQTSRENSAQIKLTQTPSIKTSPDPGSHTVDLLLEF